MREITARNEHCAESTSRGINIVRSKRRERSVARSKHRRIRAKMATQAGRYGV